MKTVLGQTLTLTIATQNDCMKPESDSLFRHFNERKRKLYSVEMRKNIREIKKGSHKTMHMIEVVIFRLITGMWKGNFRSFKTASSDCYNRIWTKQGKIWNTYVIMVAATKTHISWRIHMTIDFDSMFARIRRPPLETSNPIQKTNQSTNKAQQWLKRKRIYEGKKY